MNNSLGAGFEDLVAEGGKFVATIPAGTGSGTIKSGKGRLVNALVTTAGTGTGALTFQDSSGAVIGLIPATVSVTGTLFVFNMPYFTSLTWSNPANGPAVTVSYN